MGTYEKFLAFEVVVNVKTPEEYKQFLNRCEELKLNSIKYMRRISFTDLHKDGGIWVHEEGEVCIEYQIMRGFTMGSRKEYEDYGVEIISVPVFIKATE